jgi:hypothetical protein
VAIQDSPGSVVRRLGLTLFAASIVLCTSAAAQAPDVEFLLARVGERLAEYYARAQTLICIEKTTVQPIGRDFGPIGFPRVTEAELRVETGTADTEPGEARIVRQVLKVNGRPPREKDAKKRDGCTDPEPLSTEPLTFLLPSHREEYRFTTAGFGKGKESQTLFLDFTLAAPDRRLELVPDERGREDCFDWKGRLPEKGRVWVDARSFEVTRLERQIPGPIGIRVPVAIQRKTPLVDPVTIERDDLTIRYKTITFNDPEEALLLPESIETIMVIRGGLQSTRRRQTYTNYRRFVGDARIVE